MKKTQNLFKRMFVCLGLALTLAGCPDAMGPKQEPVAGTGMVIISVAGTGERTILPLTPVFSKFEFTFEPLDGQPGHNKLTINVGSGVNAPVELKAGRWNIIAKGFVSVSGIEGIADGDYKAAEGRADNVTINAGQTKNVSIDLKGGVQAGEKGILNWDISLPNNAISAVMVIRTIEGEIIKDVNLKAQAQGNTALDSGYYFVTLTLNDQLSKTEILHIYGGMTSSVEQAFDMNALYFNNTDDFAIWLNNAPANTAATPYEIILYGLNIETDFVQDNDPLYLLYNSLKGKYVNLDLSNCKGRRIPDTSSSSANSRPDRDKIAAITLPSELTAIGDYAFDGCTGLSSVTFQGTITEDNFSPDAFPGDLRDKYLANGIGTYTLEDSGEWNQNEQASDGAFTSIAAFGAWLAAQPENTADSAYRVALNVNDLGGSVGTSGSLGNVLINNDTKYVYLDLSGSTITTIPGYAFYDESYLIGFFERRSATLTGITIPNSMTSIGDYAFFRCYSLSSVTIPDSVTSIGVGAFYNCYSLTNVTLPSSVTSIGDEAFAFCGGLKSVELPSNMTSIGFEAFTQCGLTSVTIPGSVTSFGSQVFFECDSLTSVTIGYGVTSIGEWAISRCRSLTSLTIPNSVKSIGVGAFDNCIALTSVTIPNSVESIGGSAFSNCTSLISVTIPDSVTSIGDYTFRGCTSLTSVTIPNSITSIGREAFSVCTSLTNIVIPDSVTSIGGWAFSVCTSLTSINIPASVTTIEDTTFYGCTSLTSVTIPNSITNIGDYTFMGCISLTSVTIPNSVTSIGRSAFSGCTGLTSITIPDSVTSIEQLAFSGCTSLTSVTIPDSVTSIEQLAFSGCTSLTSVTIPDSVTSIGHSAFSGCTSLTNIVIPDSVTSIGGWAFYGCTGLTSVNTGNGVTSLNGFSFSSNKNLTSVTIGNSVTTIGYEAFRACTSLTSITIGNSVTSIGGRTFQDCASLTSVTFAATSKVTSIGKEAFYGCTSLTSITIPNSVTNIEVRAFYNCSSLTSVTITDSVTSIEQAAFACCTSLASITIPDSVTSIGNTVFYGCTSLTSIIISDSVTSIGSGAFDETLWFNNKPDGLVYAGKVAYKYKGTMPANTSIVLLDGTKGIASSAFGSCASLTNIIIPNSVTSIGDVAFFGTSLASITIPAGVTSIGVWAFYVCNNLTSVTFQGMIPAGSFGDYAYRVSNDVEVYGLVSPFLGDLRDKYLAGGAGGYTTTTPGYENAVWEKQ